MSAYGPLDTAALSRALEEARARHGTGADETSAWLELVRYQALDSRECAICEAKDGPFEEHHVAGRLNSDLTVSACLRCHRRLSERQNGWDPRWQVDSCPPALKESFLWRGLSDLCEERGRHFGRATHELGKRLRAVYAKRAREAN